MKLSEFIQHAEYSNAILIHKDEAGHCFTPDELREQNKRGEFLFPASEWYLLRRQEYGVLLHAQALQHEHAAKVLMLRRHQIDQDA